MKKLFIAVLIAVVVLMLVSFLFHLEYSDITPFFAVASSTMLLDVFALALAEISMGPNAILFPNLGVRLGGSRHHPETGIKLLNSRQTYNVIFVILTLFGIFFFVRGVLAVYHPAAAEAVANGIEKFGDIILAL